MKKKVAILGSTGSIGTQALKVIRDLEGFSVCALTADKNLDLLLEQAEEFKPEFLGLTGRTTGLPYGKYGKSALLDAVDGADIVLLCVVGISGLPAFEKCLRQGITVALANKEAMVCGGKVIRDIMDQTKTSVLPVDSELSAIFQCLGQNNKHQVEKIWLTASGGAFRDYSKEQLKTATVEDALKHPNWVMGKKITVDCATMINKGLEVMEARWLFDIEPEKIEIAIHRQSIVHSMVEFNDSNIIAQLACPDMRIPIQYALTYPERLNCPAKKLNIFEMSGITFEKPDFEKFPCLKLVYSCFNDHALQVILNAANEIAVDAFINKKISFNRIYSVIDSQMEKFSDHKIKEIGDIYYLDDIVRRSAERDVC